MRIIFMGTPAFAVPSLKILLENNYEIAGVVTAPDRQKGRGLNFSHSEVKQFALENGFKILQPENLKDKQFQEEITSLFPDLIIVVAFRILPKEIYTIPKYGSFNLHASLLPKHRGAAPINWALINGDKETGVTSFFLKEKVDTGNIIMMRKIAIDENDTAGSLHDRLSQAGAEVVLETVKLIEKGYVEPIVQNDTLASPAPKIFKDDCMVNWKQEAYKIHNFIRGLSPYPTAFTHLENKSVKIYQSKITDISSEDHPGKINIKDKRLFVNCTDNYLEIIELQWEGKRRISSADFINGLDKIKEYIFGPQNELKIDN